MLDGKLSRYLSLPEVKFKEVHGRNRIGHLDIYAEKERTSAVCPKCASLSSSVYDHRWVRIKDEPLRGSSITLKIKKRRMYCKTCRKPFTEPIQGILPRKRTTERYKRSLLWACENFSDLKKVRKAYRCSNSFLYKTLYEQLSLKTKSKINYPWPSVIGIDEHFFSRRNGRREFATVVTDMKNKRLRAVCRGKDRSSLHEQLKDIEGRENVKWATCDLSDTYKGFIFQHFPNAQVVADKFHVLRLLHPHLMRRRKEITGNRANAKARRLLLCSSKKLDYWKVKTIKDFLEKYPELRELYEWKERMYGFYRIKGYNRARRALNKMLEAMSLSKLKEIKTLRRTLTRWKEEVLNYFKTRLTNARTEGFNNVAKLVQKRGYGYKNFSNYSLRLLNACAR